MFFLFFAVPLLLSVPCCLEAKLSEGRCPPPKKSRDKIRTRCDLDKKGIYWNFSQRVSSTERLTTEISLGQPLQDLESISSAPDEHLPIFARVEIEVNRITGISEQSQTFRMVYTVSWVWEDCRTLHGCAPIVISNDDDRFWRFWAPNYRIMEVEDDIKAVRHTRFVFDGSGIVYFSDERVSTLRCPMDLKNMPFDVQNCTITLHVPNTDTTTVRLNWANAEPVHGRRLTDVMWNIQPQKDWLIKEGSKKIRSPLHMSLADKSPRENYLEGKDEEKFFEEESQRYESRILAHFTMTRVPTFLVVEYVLQPASIWLLSWIGLWLDPEAIPARAGICCVTVLTASNKISALAQSLPPISYRTRLKNFVTMTFLMIILNVIEYGVLSYALSNVDAGKRQKRHSTWKHYQKAMKKQEAMYEPMTAIFSGAISSPSSPCSRRANSLENFDDAPVDPATQPSSASIPTSTMESNAVRAPEDDPEGGVLLWITVHLEWHARWVSIILYTVFSICLLSGAWNGCDVLHNLKEDKY